MKLVIVIERDYVIDFLKVVINLKYKIKCKLCLEV